MSNIPIHSFSKLSGIESSKLRYWEATGVFSPIGRNPITKYRYYSKSQLLNLIYVTTLCALNVPLKTIAQFVTKRDPDSLLKIYEKQEKLLDYEMNRLLRRYSVIHSRRELIYQGINVDEKLIHVVPRDEKAIIIWPYKNYSHNNNENDAFLEALAFIISVANEHHISLSFPIGGLFNSMDTFEQTPKIPNRFYSIDPIGHHCQDAGDYLTGYSRGYNNSSSDLPKRMSAYAKEKSLELVGPVYLEYLIDETCTSNKAQYLARYSIAVKK